jgi:beta-lactam-binding protein with PASTA domain
VTAGRPDFEPEGRIVLPVLIGLRTGQARRLLDGLDLDVSIGSDGRGSMGTILAQSEEPGSLLRPGTRITLVVSDGRDRSRAPS